MTPKTIITLLFFLISLNIFGQTDQQNPVVLNFSQMTSTFDGSPPIGQEFTIGGNISPEVLAVQVESFGFLKGLPSSLSNNNITINVNELCETLNNARENRLIVKGGGSWERQNNSETRFTINHKRLYYGRDYFFQLTYFKRLDVNQQKELLRSNLKQKFDEIKSLITLVGPKAEPSAIPRKLKEINNLNLIVQGSGNSGEINSCLNKIIDINTKTQVNLFDIVKEENLYLSIANKAIGIFYRDSVKTLETQLEVMKAVLGDIPPAQSELVSKIREEMNKKNWKNSMMLVNKDLKRALDNSSLKTRLNDLVDLLSDLNFYSIELGGGLSDDQIIDRVINDKNLNDLLLNNINRFVYATSSRPYFETISERNPFTISLDGGLVYAPQIEDILPIVAANIKINAIDFNDPFDERTEFSILIGLGMTPPSDLDPDYTGIFGGTGNRSLLMGVGARSPIISRYLRLQVGTLLYRQVANNPLIKDNFIKGSPYIGVSLDSSVLTFIANLFNNRTAFNLR